MPDIFPYQQLAEPLGDPPPPPPPAPELSWLPSMEVPVPGDPGLYVQDFTEPPLPTVAPDPAEAIQWQPVTDQQPPEEPAPMVDDFSLAIYPTLPTPPAFEEAWQHKVSPTPEDEPVPASVAVVDASTFVPAPPIDLWQSQSPEPVLDDPVAFNEVAASPLPVFTAEFLVLESPPPVLGDELPTPAELVMQVVETYPQPSDLIQASNMPVAEEDPAIADALLLPLSDVVPVDRWFVLEAVPVLLPEDAPELGQMVIDLFPRPTVEVPPLDAWFTLTPVPLLPDHEVFGDFCRPILIIPPQAPAALGFYVEAVSWFRPGPQAVGFDT